MCLVKSHIMAMSAYLLSRIEDQCIERFDKRFPDGMYTVLEQEQLKQVLISWLEFWYAERPATKSPRVVPAQEMKQYVCDCKIYIILALAEENGMLEEIPGYMRRDPVSFLLENIWK